MLARVTPVVAAVVLLSACETVNSKDLRTSGISAHIVVSVSGDGTTVGVQLSAGSLTSVQLQDGDELTASAGGHTVTLSESNALGVDGYHGQLDGVTRPGTVVTVALHRDGDTDAPRSVVRLPAPFRVTAGRPSYSRRADAITLHVSHGVSHVGVTWTGSCAVGNPAGLALDGPPFVLPSGSITSYDASAKAPRACDLTLAVTRSDDGELDAAFKGGSIVAQRASAVVVRSVP